MNRVTQDDIMYVLTAAKDNTFFCKEHVSIIRDNYKEAVFLYECLKKQGYCVITLDLLFRDNKKLPVTIKKHRNTSTGAAKDKEPAIPNSTPPSFELTD